MAEIRRRISDSSCLRALKNSQTWFHEARFEGFSGRKNFLSAHETVLGVLQGSSLEINK
jgi:hypothetical protein